MSFRCPRCSRLNEGLVDELGFEKYGYCGSCAGYTANWQEARPRPRVDLMRPAPGVQRCCICFEARKVEDLYVDAQNEKWDVCADGTCAAEAGLI